MPLPWPNLPATVHAMSALAEQQEPTARPQIHQHGGLLQFLTLPSPHYELERGGVSFDETTLTADHIEYYSKGELPDLRDPGIRPGTVFADGNVVVTDPLGTFHASRFEFSTLTHTGFADDIELEVEGLFIKAEHIVIGHGVWTLTGTTIRATSGILRASFHSNLTVIRLGDEITVYRPKISVADHSVSFTQTSLSLTPGFSQSVTPLPGYDSVDGFGIHWQPGYRLNNDLAVNGAFGSNQKTLPGYAFHLSRTFTSEGERDGLVVAGTDLDRRFGGAYFDTISVRSPEDERRRLATPRSTFSIGSNYNYQVLDRLGNEEFARPFEATFQQSFRLPAGFLGEVHTAYQNLRLIGEANRTRWYSQGLIDAPLFQVAPNLEGHVRLEGLTYQGANEDYSWLRGETGLIYRAASNLRFGAAAVVAGDFGTPLYQVDRLYSKDGYLLRGDWKLGPRQLSTIFALDGRSGRWYDTEFMLTQVMGPLQVYAIWRSFPGEFILGIEVRPDSLFNQLARRSPGHAAPPPADQLR